MTIGEVVSIHYVRASGGPATQVNEIEVRTNFGIPHDYRSGSGKKRQLTLVEEDALVEASRILSRPVPDGASRRQVVVRGIELNSMIGRSVRIGDIVLSVEQYCAPCGRMNETLGAGGRDALRWKAGVCCSVQSGGVLKVGEKVEPLNA